MPPPLPLPLPPWPRQRQQARVGSLPKHTRHSIAVVTAALKAEWEAQKKQNRQLLAMRERQQTLSQRPTTKKDTHRPAKLTSNTLSSFNAAALRNCPGATKDQTTKGLAISIMKMVAAETTGCRLATKPELHRLQNSAKNCNTTQGNYNTKHTTA